MTEFLTRSIGARPSRDEFARIWLFGSFRAALGEAYLGRRPSQWGDFGGLRSRKVRGKARPDSNHCQLGRITKASRRVTTSIPIP